MSSKKGSPVGILLLVVAGGVLSAIANYWRELLALGLTGLVAWAIYKFIVSGKASPEQAPTVSPPEQPITPASPRPDIAPFVKRQPAPQAVASNNGNDYWVSPGRSVTVNGYTIEGGVYIGKGLSAVASSEVEPALINRDLPINRQTGDCTIRHLDYWPSYERATPTARTAYLEWLSTGRNRLNADIGYVFLFFYGLERRALHDARTSAAAESDVAWIKAEVERLLSIYGGNGSFHSYASSFLDLLNYQRYDSELYKQPPPLVEPGRGLGLGHRIGLGECVKQGAPLPADWAYAWFYADPTTLLRTAARRCPDEFRALFLQRYGEVFGAGLAIAPNKTQLKFERRPASSSFTSGGQKHFLQFDLPDPSVLTAPVKKLQGIADWCYPKLDGYSRFLGKAGANKESFDALLELPLALWPPQYRQVFEKMRGLVTGAQRPAAISFEKFKSWFPDWQTVNKAKLQSLYRVLGEAGLGIEPDVRFGGAVPGPESTVVLFADDLASSTTSPSPRYTAAALTLQLGAAVAAADNDADDAEKGVMTRHLEEWLHLSESERRRLHAFTRLMFASPPKLTGLKSKVEVLAQEQREALGDFLALIAQSDASVTPAEIKVLEKCFKLLGLDPQRVYTTVHAATTEPVTVRPAAAGEGFAIPKPKPAAKSGFTLDAARIAELQKDTERVSAILGSIFAGETPEPEKPAVVEVEQTEAEKPTVLGLEAGSSAFVITLLTRPQWTRAELDELAQDREFMLDGMLEKINDASFDKFDKPLLEGDDPVDLNQEVVRELMQ